MQGMVTLFGKVLSHRTVLPELEFRPLSAKRRGSKVKHFLVPISLWRRKWPPTPVPLPGKSHGQTSLIGYSPWGRKESDTNEQLHFDY